MKKLSLMVVSIMVLFMTCTAMAAWDTDIIFQEGADNALVTGYSGTQDDWFYGHPSYLGTWGNYNHGQSQTMPVHSDPSNSILKFTELEVLQGEYVSIDDAYIRLIKTAAVPANPDFDIEFLQIADNNADWIEGTGGANWNDVALAGEPSWNDRSSPTAWTGGGSALGGAISLGTMAYSPAHPQYTEYWKQIPAALVEQWISGGVNAGIVMKMADGTISNASFYTSEHIPHPTLGNLRPKLYIRYTTPEPMTVVLLGLGGLLIRRKK